MKTRLFFYLLITSILWLLALARAEANGLEWEVVSRSNFSNQIRLNPNLILLVTLPWFGESRSLMKDLAERIANEQEEYGSPKLMILHKNKERMLADAIGATDDITIIFYHHSLPYKFRGRLRSQNILSSFQYLISHYPEHLPIQPLSTHGELKSFLQSTDKAIILLEFCGWSQQLLATGGIGGISNDIETNGSLAAQSKKDQPFGNEKMTCDAQNGFSRFPWLEELNWVRWSDSNKSYRLGVSCSSEKFQQFDTFLTKFIKIAREFSLPPEKLQFGLVANKSLLSTLEDEDSSSWLPSLDLAYSDTWFLTVHFSGCPTCSLVLKKGDDLESAIHMQNPLVTELGDGSQDPTLLANKPSLLLFIDRSSDSLVARRKSREAFDAFRTIAFQYHNHNVSNSNFMHQTHLPGHQNKKLSTASRKVVIKDKLTIRVVNEGKQITLDKIAPGLQGDSLREILAYVLKGEKEMKLSTLAKQAGFQLLSEDFDVKSDTPEKEVLPEADIDLQKDEIAKVDNLLLEDDEQQKANPDKSSNYMTFGASKQPSRQPVDSHGDRDLGSTKEELDLDEKLPLKSFTGTFSYSDGEYQLLRALTGGVKIPSVVMVDPVQQKHYVLKQERNLSFSALSDFVNEFANGSLTPYQKSESGVKAPAQAPSPPFVNLDFHVSDSIPELASDKFEELVIGFNQSDNLAWRKDVMVLFSNSWCGFCQRMELVVREVYRVFNNYATVLNVDTLGDMKSSFPQFYFMDCTRNDCNLILRSIAQREAYPHLLLFPAESKVAVSYEGDTVVSNIIKFIVDNGNKACDLVKEKGTLLIGQERENEEEGSDEDVALSQKDKHTEFVLENTTPKFREEDSNEDAEALSKEDKLLEVVLEDIFPEDKEQGSYKDVEAHLERDKHQDDVLGDTFPEDKKGDEYFDVESLFQWDELDLDKKEDSYLDIESLFEWDDHDEVVPKHMTPEEEFRYNRRYIRSQKLANPTQLGVGSLLVATEKLLKVPPFENSVVLIVNAHKDTGFQGVIINKHISWDWLDVDEVWLEELLKDARVSLGGPLMQEGLPIIALTRERSTNDYPEVLPNVFFLHQLDTIREIQGLESRKHVATNYWFFLGYSSWDYDQLFMEINRGAWNVDDAYERIHWPWL